MKKYSINQVILESLKKRISENRSSENRIMQGLGVLWKSMLWDMRQSTREKYTQNCVFAISMLELLKVHK